MVFFCPTLHIQIRDNVLSGDLARFLSKKLHGLSNPCLVMPYSSMPGTKARCTHEFIQPSVQFLVRLAEKSYAFFTVLFESHGMAPAIESWREICSALVPHSRKRLLMAFIMEVILSAARGLLSLPLFCQAASIIADKCDIFGHTYKKKLFVLRFAIMEPGFAIAGLQWRQRVIRVGFLSRKKGHRPTAHSPGLPHPDQTHSAERRPLWGASSTLALFGLLSLRTRVVVWRVNAQACTLNSISYVGTALCHYIGVLLLVCVLLTRFFPSRKDLFVNRPLAALVRRREHPG